MLRLLILYLCTALSLACFCTPAQGTRESFCKADWVSHVVLLGMERNGDRNSDITFVVRHVDIFKKPNYATHLPTIINTPSSDAGCGIKLQIGKEYLLAGAVRSKDYFFTLRCGQIIDDSPIALTDFGMPMEWKHVSMRTKSSLATTNCDSFRDITATDKLNKI